MSKGRVLVIDDSPIVRKMAEVALQEEGYEVFTAEDGEEGLKTTKELMPTVILVDFIMPKLSGYQFCQAIRDDESLKNIPIILITGKGEDVGKKFLERFGVVDYFIKPFKSVDLAHKVNSIVEMQETILQPQPEDIVTPILSDTPIFELPEVTPVIEPLETSEVQPVVSKSGEKLQFETDMEKTVERVTMKFLKDEFQFTLQKSISDILKQAGVIKSTNIILSGNLADFAITDILYLTASKGLNAKLSIFSEALSADIYTNNNNITHASLRKGLEAAYETTKVNMSDSTVPIPQDILEQTKKSVYDTICAIMELEAGSFAIEKAGAMESGSVVNPSSINISDVLIEASRSVNEKVFAGVFDDSTKFIKTVSDTALKNYNLNKNELIICACVNGERSFSDILDIANIETAAGKRSFYVLINARIIKII